MIDANSASAMACIWAGIARQRKAPPTPRSHAGSTASAGRISSSTKSGNTPAMSSSE